MCNPLFRDSTLGADHSRDGDSHSGINQRHADDANAIWTSDLSER